MLLTASRRLSTAAIVAAAALAGPALAAAPAGAHTGGVSLDDVVQVATPASSTAAPATADGPLDVAAVTAALHQAAGGSVGYAFRIAGAHGQLVGGGAGGYARRPLDGTQDASGTPFSVDTRIEVQLPAVQQLLPAKVAKGTKARRSLAKLSTRLLTPAGVQPTTCKAADSRRAAHIYNAERLSIGGTIVAPEAGSTCGRNRGVLLSVTDLVRVAPLLEGGRGSSRGAWTTAAGQSDDGQVSWQSGDGRFSGGREIHTCVVTTAGHDLSILFNAQTPGDQSPCRILLDAINASRTAS